LYKNKHFNRNTNILNIRNFSTKIIFSCNSSIFPIIILKSVYSFDEMFSRKGIFSYSVSFAFKVIAIQYQSWCLVWNIKLLLNRENSYQQNWKLSTCLSQLLKKIYKYECKQLVVGIGSNFFYFAQVLTLYELRYFSIVLNNIHNHNNSKHAILLQIRVRNKVIIWMAIDIMSNSNVSRKCR